MSRKDAGLGDCRTAFHLHDAADRNTFLPEGLQQFTTSFVIANDTDRQYIHTEVREIVNRIRSSARHDRTAAMLQDQYRRLTAHPRDLAKNEFVGHQVAQN